MALGLAEGAGAEIDGAVDTGGVALCIGTCSVPIARTAVAKAPNETNMVVIQVVRFLIFILPTMPSYRKACVLTG